MTRHLRHLQGEIQRLMAELARSSRQVSEVRAWLEVAYTAIGKAISTWESIK